jgi:glyoxylase-like metal-dependent hydrolase (beta-lactamase superfamily II)
MATVARCVLAVLILAVAGFAAAADKPAAVERMYVLYCGESITSDVSANWSPGVDVGKSREFSDNCYLIKHAKGWLLWDTGMSDKIADMPEGMKAAGGLLTLYVKKTLAAQLRELNLQPSDIQRVALSHFHSDHAGNGNLFAGATLYIQQPEFDAAFGTDAGKFGFAPALYEKLATGKVMKLTGDHDVFGDGSVTIVATYGHTPGHQSLLVRLPKTGPVILSGDAVHFKENWDNRRVPARNFDRGMSVEAMERIAQLMTQDGAKLWINHDKQQSDAIAHAPQFVE